MHDGSRAKTLASLDAFLDAQRQLLARTQSDLHKLSELRERALEHPEEFLENIEEELNDPAFKMSQYEPQQWPRDIDWDLFTSLDPSPFSGIVLPGPPPLSAATKQRSEPSELQRFVREASETILADFKPFFPNDDEEDTADADPDADDEQRLAELVRNGKVSSQPHQAVELDIEEPHPRRRRIGSGLRLKPPRGAGSLEPIVDATTKGKVDMIKQRGSQVEKKLPSMPSLSQRPKRSRRPTTRPDANYQLSLPSPPPPRDLQASLPEPKLGSDVAGRKSQVNDAPNSESSASPASDVELSPQARPQKNAKQQEMRIRKAPSETFNLPWSVSEQHLLEKLLDEIPAGEKHRWAKISRAMAGRRTARQVASRVQKYFEKLKKFGVEPD